MLARFPIRTSTLRRSIWERQVNSFALQVEPDRFKHSDQAILGCDEALHLEKIRNIFFGALKKLSRS
jgi:hypothetical protein